MKFYVVCLCWVAILATTQPSKAAYIYDFASFDAGTKTAIPGLELYVEVSEVVGQSKARFEFHNTGSVGTITSIYLEEGVLAGISSIDWGTQADVQFEAGAHPSTLPGGNALLSPFVTGSPSEDFVVGAVPSPMKYGAGPGEWVAITFDLQSGKNFGDLISSLDNVDMRIGAHVQGLSNPPSIAAVNEIPEPATLALVGLGTLLLRRSKVYLRYQYKK